MTSKNTDPAAKPQRRTFTPEYKLRIIAEHDACTTGTERAALLRRERLYYSHLAEWRTAREAGILQALAPNAPAPPPKRPLTRKPNA